MNYRRGFELLVVLTVIFLVSVGCSRTSFDISDEPMKESSASDMVFENEFDKREQSPDLPRRIQLDELSVIDIEHSWSREFHSVFSLSISNCGEDVAVVMPPPNGSGIKEVSGFDASSDGEEKWSYRFSETGYVSSEVRIFPHGGVGAAAYSSNGQGIFSMLDAEGDELLTVSLDGVSCFKSSPDGETFALIDRYNGELSVYDVEDGQQNLGVSVSEEALVDFIGVTGLLLVQSDDELFIVDGAGNKIWQQNLEFRLRGGVTVTDDAEKVIVATRDPDSTLYLFDRSGELLWKYLLFPRGSNEIRLNDDNSKLLVYNIGTESGIFLMDLKEKEPIWRYFFVNNANDGEEDGDDDTPIPRTRVRDVVFGTGGSAIAHIVRINSDDSEVKQKHELIFIDQEGELRGKTELGTNLKVELARDGSGAVVARGQSDETTGSRTLNELYYYDFTSIMASEIHEDR